MKQLYEYIKSEYQRTHAPVSAKKIIEALGFTHRRRVTEAIRNARLNGYNIDSTSHGYIVHEGRKTMSKMYHQMDSMMETIISMTGNEGFNHIISKLFQIKKDKLQQKGIHPEQLTIYDMEVTR
jgi:biotin operon repressor